MIGLAARPVCAAPFAVIQNRPLHSHQRVACHNTRLESARNAADNGLYPPNPRHDAEVRSGPSTDRAPVVLVYAGSTEQPLRLRPWCRIPRTDTSRQSKVGSRNVAQVRHRRGRQAVRSCAARPVAWPSPATIPVLPAATPSRRPFRSCCSAKMLNFVGLGVDTRSVSATIYRPIRRAVRFTRCDCAPSKLLTDDSERHPISVGGLKLRRLSGVPESGAATVPGCLTSE